MCTTAAVIKDPNVESPTINFTDPTEKSSIPLSCCSSLQLWWYQKFFALEGFLHVHHWKVLSILLLLVLPCLGLKMVTIQTDFYKLWVGESGRLSSELDYLAKALRSGEAQHSMGLDPGHSETTSLGGHPGSEFMGSMEAIIQAAPTSSSGVLTTQAIQDHMDLLIRIHRLEVKVGSSKWRLEDLCQRPELLPIEGMHSIQAYVEKIIPCLVITPVDCFWDGSKSLAPGKAIQVPWLGEQKLLEWPSLNPQQLLNDLRSKYGNNAGPELEDMMTLFDKSGISHGYLTRPCLNPTDLSCPALAPNYAGEPPNVAQALSNGCPSFAANVLHWSDGLLVGGQECVARNSTTRVRCENTKKQSGEHVLVSATALQSLFILRSPKDLYLTVRVNDPYRHDAWTLSDAQNVLDQWRNAMKKTLLLHNKGLPSDRSWKFYAFTDSSIRDLLTQATVQTGLIQLIGVVLLMLLYGLVCLLGWREPSRSQCWLALFGLMLIILSLVAGLGVCATFGLPFNVLTVQILPFLILGLGMEGLFTFTTCHTCMMPRSGEMDQQGGEGNIVWTTHVLAEHGTSLFFGALAISVTFFVTAYLPVPVVRQFCLQAGILIIIQSVTLIVVFPALLKLDTKRRAQQRMDVLCCVRQSLSSNRSTKFARVPGVTDTTEQQSNIPMRIVETTSTKVRLNGNSVTTVKVSVSTQKPIAVSPMLSGYFIDPQDSTAQTATPGEDGVNVMQSNFIGEGASDCLCTSCQSETCYYGPLLVRLASGFGNALSRFLFLRLLVILLGLGLMVSACVLAPMNLSLGLNFLSLTPKDAIEHDFLVASREAIGLCNFQLIARGTDLTPVVAHDSSWALAPGIDFPGSQAKLRQLYSQVQAIPGVSLTGRRVWLDSLRDWLAAVQDAFDQDRRLNRISASGNWTPEAGELGLLGLRLIVQTNHGIEINRIKTARMVSSNGIIDPSAFFIYLRAWRSYDNLNSTAPPCAIYPDPKPLHIQRFTRIYGTPEHLQPIKPAEEIEFVQTNFFATGYGNFNSQIELVKKVRELTEQVTSQGVPVFPSGVPFTTAELYLQLWHYVSIAGGILSGSLLVMGLIFLPNPMATLLSVSVGGGGALCACIVGLLLLNLEINAISAGLLLISFGLGVKLSSGVLCGWYGPQHNIHRASANLVERQRATCSLRTRKLVVVLRNHISPVLHSNVSLVLSVALLAASRVEFIADHFFRLVSIICLVCFFNSIVLLPTICFMLEPIFSSQIFPSFEPVSKLSTSLQNLPSSVEYKEAETVTGAPSRPSATISGDKLSRQTSDEHTPFSVDASRGDENDNDDEAMKELCASLKRDLSATRSLRSGPGGYGAENGQRCVSVSVSPSAALLVSLASALRNSSRPSSLSTISEEPSHSSSTVSLHQFRSSPTEACPPQASRIPLPAPQPLTVTQASSLSPEYYEALISRAAAAAKAAVTNQRAGRGSSQRSTAHHLSFNLQRSVLPPPSQMKNLLQAVTTTTPHSISTRSPKWWVDHPPPYSSVCPPKPPMEDSPPGHDRNRTTR